MKRILCLVTMMLVAAMVYAQASGSSQNPPSSGQSMPAAGQSMPSAGQSMPSSQGMSQSASNPAEEQRLIGLEHQWADAEKSGDAAGVARIEADGYVFTDETGKTVGKQDDVNALKSGQVKFQAFDLSDMQAHVYGDTAVVTGRANIKGTDKGKDISGTYAFTDTFVKRDGQWQAVSSQSTSVMGNSGAMPATSAPPPPPRQ
jgi:ketosteroid isomerase-like protein